MHHSSSSSFSGTPKSDRPARDSESFPSCVLNRSDVPASSDAPCPHSSSSASSSPSSNGGSDDASGMAPPYTQVPRSPAPPTPSPSGSPTIPSAAAAAAPSDDSSSGDDEGEAVPRLRTCDACARELRVEWFPRMERKHIHLGLPGRLLVRRSPTCAPCLRAAEAEAVGMLPLEERLTGTVAACIRRSRDRGCGHREAITPSLLAAKWLAQEGKCTLCGEVMEWVGPEKVCREDADALGLWKEPARPNRRVSADRVDASDPHGPYVDSRGASEEDGEAVAVGRDNVALVCVACNSAKSHSDAHSQLVHRLRTLQAENDDLRALVSAPSSPPASSATRARGGGSSAPTVEADGKAALEQFRVANARLTQQLRMKEEELRSYLSVRPPVVHLRDNSSSSSVATHRRGSPTPPCEEETGGERSVVIAGGTQSGGPPPFVSRRGDLKWLSRITTTNLATGEVTRVEKLIQGPGCALCEEAKRNYLEKEAQAKALAAEVAVLKGKQQQHPQRGAPAQKVVNVRLPPAGPTPRAPGKPTPTTKATGKRPSPPPDAHREGEEGQEEDDATSSSLRDNAHPASFYASPAPPKAKTPSSSRPGRAGADGGPTQPEGPGEYDTGSAWSKRGPSEPRQPQHPERARRPAAGPPKKRRVIAATEEAAEDETCGSSPPSKQ